eukprot:475587-Prymnesium_polylepis.2
MVSCARWGLPATRTYRHFGALRVPLFGSYVVRMLPSLIGHARTTPQEPQTPKGHPVAQLGLRPAGSITPITPHTVCALRA